jgi:hypothetical protein
MTDIEKLITTARHYCNDNFKYWSERYSIENSGHNNPYSDNDYNLFPRYNVLTAMRQGIETIVGQSFSSFETCKKTLQELGLNSHSIFTIDSNSELHLLGESGRFSRTSGRQNSIAKNAMLDERMKFINYIDTLTPEKITNIEPLPYLRRLNDKELLTVRQKLLELWSYDGQYWNPLNEKSPKETVFLMKENLTSDDRSKINELLNKRCNYRIYEITEDRIDYEIEFDSFDLDLYETMVADNTFEWVIYGSHESTITFGGTWLIEFIKELFVDRQDKVNKWERNW